MKRRQFIRNTTTTLLGFGTFGMAESFDKLNTHKMNKKAIKTTDLRFKNAFPGLKGVDMMASVYPMEPILVFTEFLMDRQVFGPHPHAGISVMTYMLPDSNESFINRDSQGDFSIIEPGGLHIMQAGAGMHHDEFPRIRGIETHGFQIWINHSSKNRFVQPMSMHAAANEVKEIITDESKVRIVHGQYGTVKSDYQMVTAVNLLHIFLNPHSTITLEADEMAFAYGLKGVGTSENETIHAQTLINYSKEGNKVTFSTQDEHLEFMFVTGTPHNEPIVYGGPFVMTTAEQMAETQHRYAQGEMGKLERYIEKQ